MQVGERGAVSIFIVIFTALLVTVVTTSFVQVMLQNQQQASDNDLSQSAYDSAMAGVEDAKRALVKLKKCQLQAVMTPECVTFSSRMTNPDAESNCELLGDIDNGGVGIVDFDDGENGHEVPVGSSDLNQAYTCVTVKVNTESYDGELENQQQAVVIPLLPEENRTTNEIEKLRISWFTREDMPISAPSNAPPVFFSSAIQTNGWLPSYAGWGDSTPPMLRAQLIQFNKGDITLSGLNGSNAYTRLLFPMLNPSPSITADSFVLDTRDSGPKTPTYGGCKTDFSYNGGYACSMEITLPTSPPVREAYLHLAGIYVKDQGVHYMVEMVGGGTDIDFNNVQPVVDSTGRASDLFRRVKASVEVTPSGPSDIYPEAALSAGNICKEFFITNNPADYNGVDANENTVACNP